MTEWLPADIHFLFSFGAAGGLPARGTPMTITNRLLAQACGRFRPFFRQLEIHHGYAAESIVGTRTIAIAPRPAVEPSAMMHGRSGYGQMVLPLAQLDVEQAKHGIHDAHFIRSSTGGDTGQSCCNVGQLHVVTSLPRIDG